MSHPFRSTASLPLSMRRREQTALETSVAGKLPGRSIQRWGSLGRRLSSVPLFGRGQSCRRYKRVSECAICRLSCSSFTRRAVGHAGEGRGVGRAAEDRRPGPAAADTGFHFVDFLGREAKADGIESLTAQPYTVHSTINATLQRDTEAALQEGLAHYEIENGRVQFHGPEANIADAVQKLSAGNHGAAPGATADAAPVAMPAWQQALAKVHLPLYDVHWERAVILKSGKRGDEALRVGLADGRILPLTTRGLATRRNLNQYDVVYVHVTGGGDGRASDGRTRARGAASAQAQLRVRPTVQGATLVLENKTGRILAMAGSFSYRLSQLNRTSQTQRQPGSAIKPVTYLTALQKGLQPNTLIPDEPFTLPPIGSPGNRLL